MNPAFIWINTVHKIKKIYSHIVNALIEHSSNKIFTSILFILEHNINIMGSMKSIIGKHFGKFPKAFGFLSIYIFD